MTVAMPSNRKIQAQPGLPPMPSILAMANARRPEKAPDSALAQKKMARRVCSWFWTYHCVMRYTAPEGVSMIPIVKAERSPYLGRNPPLRHQGESGRP